MDPGVEGIQVVHEDTLESLQGLPAGVHIVSYGPKEVLGRPFPRNIWGNQTCLQLVFGLSLNEFLEQVCVICAGLRHSNSLSTTPDGVRHTDHPLKL